MAREEYNHVYTVNCVSQGDEVTCSIDGTDYLDDVDVDWMVADDVYVEQNGSMTMVNLPGGNCEISEEEDGGRILHCEP